MTAWSTATPDGAQVWLTLTDTGKVQEFDAQPPFALLKTLDTGPITDHVNIVRNANGDHSGRQAAPWHLAVRRRHAGLCRPRE